MITRQRTLHTAIASCVLALATACSDDSGSTAPGPETPDLEFSQTLIDLGEELQGSVQLVNAGSQAVGPIGITASAVLLDGTTEIPGGRLQLVPTSVSTLNAGSSTTIAFTVIFDQEPPAGDYAVALSAMVDDEPVANMGIAFAVSAAPPSGIAASIQIDAGTATPRQGDVIVYSAVTLDQNGDTITDPSLVWFVTPVGAGLIMPDGRFVGYTTGAANVVATAAGIADTLAITIGARGSGPGTFSVVGQGAMSERYTSDVWVHGSYAYTGTWGCRTSCGDRMNVWDISNPALPQLGDHVTVDARVVNDVKIRSDGQIGVITHESSVDGLNGVTILDMANPASPTIITRFTLGLESGVHNVWVEGDFVYIVVDGVGSGLRIMDISNPAVPQIVASEYLGSSFLHDVYVRGGLAFLSQWNDGLVIVDVGNGIVGGSPSNPKEVGRTPTAGGQTHNAWYWPQMGYVFVGEEDFGTPGMMHVVDATNLTNPVEVATFRVNGDTPHNFWLDEANAILYMAWYSNGVVALDVSGELLGQLDRQDRVLATIDYGSGFGCPFGAAATCAWAPQLENGIIYAADLNTGLWALQPNF